MAGSHVDLSIVPPIIRCTLSPGVVMVAKLALYTMRVPLACNSAFGQGIHSYLTPPQCCASCAYVSCQLGLATRRQAGELVFFLSESERAPHLREVLRFCVYVVYT